jgi:hypothetical protein
MKPATHPESPPAGIQYLLQIWFATMPFTHALTLEISFPLKIYEIISAGLLIYLFRNISEHDDPLQPFKPILFWLSLFAAAYGISFIVGMILIYLNFPVLPEWARGFNYSVFKSLLKYGQILLTLTSFVMVIHFLRSEQKKYLDSFLIGATIACTYGFYLFISAFIGHEPYLLPGIDPTHSRIGMWGAEFLRHGTFKEGNHFALYLILSSVLGLAGFERYKLYRYLFIALYCLFAILTTFSALGLVLGLLLSVFFLSRQILIFTTGKKLRLFSLILGFGILSACLSIIWTSSYFKYFVKDKIAGSQKTWVSKRDRLKQAGFALDLFKKYPVVGIGPANFGIYYDEKYRTGGKAISNNVYSEILAEGGALAFIPFVFFLMSIMRFLFRNSGPSRNFVFILGCVLTFLGWMAYPSFSVMFIWAFFSLALTMSESRIT